MKKPTPVSVLLAALSVLLPTDFVVLNSVGNLAILRDGQQIGYIEDGELDLWENLDVETD